VMKPALIGPACHRGLAQSALDKLPKVDDAVLPSCQVGHSLLG
jgi:hypothetical protein